VTLQRAPQRAEFRQQFGAEEAPFGEQAVIEGGRVALREDEAVAFWPLGVPGVAAKVVPEEGNTELYRGKRTTGVAALGLEDHLDDVRAHALRDIGKFGYGDGSECGHRRQG
jgi:hypothetical protein